MHFCKFNLEFIGLGYKPSGCYEVTTFELYKCKKCGKLIFENKEIHHHVFSNLYKEGLREIVNCGYKPLGELINTSSDKSNSKGTVLTLIK